MNYFNPDSEKSIFKIYKSCEVIQAYGNRIALILRN